MAAARSRWVRRLAFFAIALVGLALRIPQLGARPMHTDEAVNAYIVGQLLAGEPYHYDPQDRHGPALAAIALPLVRMQGARSFSALTESGLRLTSVLAGTITIVLCGVAAEAFGFLPCVLAAILFAVGPLPVYYDRYFIHESLFCAATFGLILSVWRAFRTHSTGAAALAGVCAALMLACKETAVLHWGSLAVATVVVRAWNLRAKGFARSWRPWPLLAGLCMFPAILVVLFTWFGRNWSGLPALLRMGPDVLARAGGQGHEKPFWYFGQLLVGGWSGGLLLGLALLGLIITVRKRDDSPYQWLACYGLCLGAVYSLIPYKTPWLALNFWLPLTLFAARAVGSFGRWAGEKLGLRLALPALGTLAALVAVLIAHDVRNRVFLHPADETNPYAYAHTSEDILGLPTEVRDFARQSGISKPRIAVIASDPWPLPWYLRQFNEVGFWQPGQQVQEADFYITSTEAADQYGFQLRKFRPEFFGVRPNVLILLWSPEPK